MLYKLGETKAEVHIDTVIENRDTALSLVEQARYTIDIFSQDLDAELYNNEAFEQAVFQLTKKHPTTRVRILVQDSMPSVQHGHRLIRLAQNLTSSVLIHNPARTHQDERCGFLVVDQLGFLHRVNANHRNYHASYNFMSPLRARQLSDLFNEMWEHSTPDAQTRRMHI